MINLTLHVVEAKNLINTGSIRVSDPYCKITVNNETKKSRAVHNTTNPRWDYRFYFQNVPLDAPIAIEVFDKNLIRSHSFMGRMYVTVNQLRQQSKGWWPLLSREGEGNLGSIYLQADFIELQRVLFNEMQYRYVNVPPQQGMVGQQAQVIPQGQTLVNQQQPMQTVGSTTPIVVGQGLQPQVVTMPSQGQVFTSQGVTQNPVTYAHQNESYSSDSPDFERNSTYIPPQGFSGQQYPIQNQGVSGQSYPVQSGTTQSSLPQVQILSGQQLPNQRSLGETSYPQGQGLTGQGLTGQSYPVQSGTTQSTFPQSQGLTQTPVNYSNQNENYKTESPYLERNNSRDFSDETSTPDLSNRDSRQHTNRSIDSPLVGGTFPSTTNTSGLSGNQSNRELNYIDFSLHVVEARNLHNTGTIRSSDPFLEISVAEESTKTKTVTNTVNPRWDETFSFKDVPANGKILFQVFDRNLITSNQVMGRFETDINSLRERPSNWWTLYGPEGESTSGEIYLDCYFN